MTELPPNVNSHYTCTPGVPASAGTKRCQHQTQTPVLHNRYGGPLAPHTCAKMQSCCNSRIAVPLPKVMHVLSLCTNILYKLINYSYHSSGCGRCGKKQYCRLVYILCSGIACGRLSTFFTPRNTHSRSTGRVTQLLHVLWTRLSTNM